MNYLLAGEPAAVDPERLRPLVTGFLAATEGFGPLLALAFPERVVWDRVIYRLAGGRSEARAADAVAGRGPVPPAVRALTATDADAVAGPPPGRGPVPPGVRALTATDADAVAGLPPELGWVTKTWGGAAGLAARGHAFGAFDGGRLVAVVGTFFLGTRHEDAFAATDPGWRGRGLATACARAWCAGVVARGRTPTWSTSPDNHGSRRVAERLGMELVRRDVLHVIGVELPR